MENRGIVYEFTAKPYQCSSSEDKGGWVFVALPKELSIEIRDNFKFLEEGWGRMKVTAKIGNSEWQTAIWFDSKQDTYLLPLKAVIRKKESVMITNNIKVSIWI